MAHRPPRSASKTSPTNWSGTTGAAASSAASLTNRVTRSSARLAESIPAPTPAPALLRASTKQVPAPKKRKAPGRSDFSPSRDNSAESNVATPSPRVKRQKVLDSSTQEQSLSFARARSSAKRVATQKSAMSGNGSSSKNFDGAKASKTASKRPSSRSTKKIGKHTNQDTSSQPECSSSAASSPKPEATSRKSKKKKTPKLNDVVTPPPNNNINNSGGDEDDEQEDDDDENHDERSPGNDEQDEDEHEHEDEDDSFAAALFGRGGPAGLSTTLRALSGMMSGMSSRLRDILHNLRQIDNPTMQMIALEELSNLLLVSNEDNLSGQFSPDPYVKELVTLMQPNPITGEENPEIMLLACRCIANLMEALRGSVANVVYGGAVPVLCQKLLDIQYIDVAEQALSTLSKVSIDFPASIVREGGLTACLQFLDFFATGTQRTAVTTAANCCRNIPPESFSVIRDVMPILQNVLVSHDQKVVEQGCLCVTRIVDSFKRSPEKLEQLVDPPLLRAILRLLLPGTTNLIGASIHTEFLRVLAIVARASPTLATELLKMDVVDTLYQVLTGVSPPTETADAASKIDSVVIMQALIHRPREQIYQTLDVICELLPRVKSSNQIDQEFEEGYDSVSEEDASNRKESRSTQRLNLLKDCKPQTRRFAIILLPTLTDAYSSTVNLSVRQKVLTAQLKILSNLETGVIAEALRPVTYSSFLASILSQEDHPSLVMFALQASELLAERLHDVYQYQFYREGVISEIEKLASKPLDLNDKPAGAKEQRDRANSDNLKVTSVDADRPTSHEASAAEIESHEPHDEDGDEDGEDEDEDEDEDIDDDEVVVRDEEGIESASSESSDEDINLPSAVTVVQDLVVLRAQSFLETFDTDKSRAMREQAVKIQTDLRDLASAISTHHKNESTDQSYRDLFVRLAAYFDGDALDSITSSELLDSGIVRSLIEVLDTSLDTKGTVRNDFLAAFMRHVESSDNKIAKTSYRITAFSVLTRKLQDLLSRSEHFEVLTVNSSSTENSRSNSTSMLSRQIRLKLNADADSEIPLSFREMIVSIHAIATFKALDDYLRPRMSLSERPPMGQRRHDMLQQLANARMAQLQGAAESGMFSPFGMDLGVPAKTRKGAGDLPAETHSVSRGQTSLEEPPESGEPASDPQRRRSGRFNATTGEGSTLKPSDPLKPSSNETVIDKLECADEKALDDGEPPVPAGIEAGLDAIVGEVADNSSEEDTEATAVNMEVGSTGKVTARQDDGTRIFTPQPPGTPSSGPTKPLTNQSPSVAAHKAQQARERMQSSRPSSYAAALASTPQDWHIQFSIDDQVISHDTTIYRAVHHNRTKDSDPSGRAVWSGMHSVKFKKVKGPPPPTPSVDDSTVFHQYGNQILPPSLDEHPVTSSILSLLRTLHDMNIGLEYIRATLGRKGVHFHAEPSASFINTKLTAKMNRQLEEPLIVASNCLPSWSEDLARTFPFLFPFETRHLFLQSTSFGYSRSIIRWQNNQEQNDDRRDRRRDDRPLMGRPQRQKVRISRNRILESAMKVMEMYGASPSVLEVEYFEEVGTGLGPTLEFYSTVSREFSKKKLKMWRENDSNSESPYAFGKNGLFPSPLQEKEAASEVGKKLLHFFRMLGKFVARSMLDSRIIDINFSAAFFKLINAPTTPPSLALLRMVDSDLANSLAHVQEFASLKAKILATPELTIPQQSAAVADLSINGAHVEDLGLDFSLPGYSDVELVADGANIALTMDNVEQYVERILELSLGSGVQKQLAAFQEGFSSVFSCSSLRAFTPNELVMLFGKVEEDWSIETLMDSIKADHGFNMDSKSVKNLLSVMSDLTKQQRRDFLQFVTGSPKLPIGGFKSLTPMFTVVCKASEPPYTSDDYLPSVMTCVNYLKLPDYSTAEILKQKLHVAIKEGQGAFHLS